MQKFRKAVKDTIQEAIFLAIVLLSASQSIAAKELRDILRQSLLNDPLLLEAQANKSAAGSATKATRAGHYPVISVTGTQTLLQKNDDSDDDLSNGLGVKGSLNLYAWGGIEAGVKRDKQKEIYYDYKYYETQEELGKTIGKLYLRALRAKESLLINEQSLNRHNKLLNDLGVVVQYDSGRRSELIEARSRQLQVQTTIIQLRRTMELALSELSKYIPEPIKPEDLQDPFSADSTTSLINRFRQEDNGNNPTYLAQKAERESTRYELDVSKASRLPALNLEGYMSNKSKQVYLNLQWNLFDEASRHTVNKNKHTLTAADAKLDQILREVGERARTAEIDMAQSERQVNISAEHIVAQKEVVKAYELQFKVARRTLTDVLNSYIELSRIEQENITARNDFRDAALEYLVSQSQIARWAGITNSQDMNSAK